MILTAEFIGGPLHGERRNLESGVTWFYNRAGSIIDGYERVEGWFAMLRAYYLWRSHEVLPARTEERGTA